MIDDEILEELKEIKSLDEIAKHIAYMLYGNVSVWEENGICYFYNIRAEVDRFKGVKIAIYSDEHPPPHFHVKSGNGNDASFRIDNGKYISGKIGKRERRNVEHYLSLSKDRLIEIWNKSRP
jgi:hypothetical protein